MKDNGLLVVVEQCRCKISSPTIIVVVWKGLMNVMPSPNLKLANRNRANGKRKNLLMLLAPQLHDRLRCDRDFTTSIMLVCLQLCLRGYQPTWSSQRCMILLPPPRAQRMGPSTSCHPNFSPRTMQYVERWWTLNNVCMLFHSAQLAHKLYLLPATVYALRRPND